MLSLAWSGAEGKNVIDLSDVKLKDHIRIYIFVLEFEVRNNEVKCSMSISSTIQYDAVMNS